MVKGKLVTFSINIFGNCQEYWVGSEIEGSVLLKLTKEIVPLKAIKLILSGVACVKFSDGHVQGSTIYSMSEDICRVTWTLWSNEGSCQQQSGLLPGQHEFPFKVQIPPDLGLPASYEGDSGFIRYSLIGAISTSEEARLEYAIAEGIIVKDIVNVNVPHLMQPLSNFKQKMVHTFWHNYGSASLSVTINRGGYFPGELILISVKVDNQSTKRVDNVNASLVQKVTYYGQARCLLGPTHQRNYCAKRIIQKIQGPGIAARETGHWNNESLLVPITAPSTIGGHHIIQLTYSVDVTVVFHKAHNLNVLIPVTIGTTSKNFLTGTAPLPYQPFVPPPSYQF